VLAPWWPQPDTLSYSGIPRVIRAAQLIWGLSRIVVRRFTSGGGSHPVPSRPVARRRSVAGTASAVAGVAPLSRKGKVRLLTVSFALTRSLAL